MTQENFENKLQPTAFQMLPLGSIQPLGWLERQMRIQADGLTGHLEEIWPDLGPNNMWLGGSSEGWERGPYYLDGLVPLAFGLQDEALIAKAKRWIDAIIASADESGWIGPVQAPNYQPYDQWPNMIVLKVLSQWVEATGDEKALAVMMGFARWLHETLEEKPIFDWGKFRWADLLASIYWLYERTGEDWLLDVAGLARQQGYDWLGHFNVFRFPMKMARDECKLETHVVNNAMAIKASAMAWRLSGSAEDLSAVYQTLHTLDRFHGQVTGVFTGDEHYAGLNPSQGTELCAVVEYMFSLEILLSVFGDPTFADRLERIAYNALPGTCTADFWAHQYDQQANQVLCNVAPRQWTNNGDDANVFGLEPNYGCCTANMHQGWPKLVSSLWMATAEGGLAAIAYGPSEVTAQVVGGVAVTVREETDYPFGEEIVFTINPQTAVEFPLMLRIPGWAQGATITLPDNEQIDATPGIFCRIEREWQAGDQVILKVLMQVETQRRYHDSIAILRGPLVFSMPIGERWEIIGREPPAADYAIYPETPWNYGLIIDEVQSENSICVETGEVGEMPFAGDSAPVKLKVTGRLVENWELEQNSAGPLPKEPQAIGDEETLTLIPYGCTHLRITEFPYLGSE